MKRIAGFKKFDMWCDIGADEFIKDVLSKDRKADILVYVRSSNLTKAMVDDRKFIFRYGGNVVYSFDFEKGEFLWNGKELYLTRQEQTALFAWLTEADGTFWKDSLRRMRERFGKDFMMEKNWFGSSI